MKGVEVGCGHLWFCANPNVFLRARKLEVFTRTLGEGKQVLKVKEVGRGRAVPRLLVTPKTRSRSNPKTRSRRSGRTWYDVVTTQHEDTHTHSRPQSRGGTMK